MDRYTPRLSSTVRQWDRWNRPLCISGYPPTPSRSTSHSDSGGLYRVVGRSRDPVRHHFAGTRDVPLFEGEIRRCPPTWHIHPPHDHAVRGDFVRFGCAAQDVGAHDHACAAYIRYLCYCHVLLPTRHLWNIRCPFFSPSQTRRATVILTTYPVPPVIPLYPLATTISQALAGTIARISG